MLKIKNIMFPDLISKQTNIACCICGDMSGEYNLYNIVSSNFTNQNCIKLASNMICEGCKKLFKLDKLRKYSYIATQKEIIYFKNNDGLKYILDLPKDPYIIGITKNWKKHTFIYCKVSYNPNECFIGTDFAMQVYFNKSKWIDIIYILKELYQIGFSKDDLLKLEPALYKFKLFNYDYKKWLHNKNILLNYNNNSMYEIIIMLLNRD